MTLVRKKAHSNIYWTTTQKFPALSSLKPVDPLSADNLLPIHPIFHCIFPGRLSLFSAASPSLPVIPAHYHHRDAGLLVQNPDAAGFCDRHIPADGSMVRCAEIPGAVQQPGIHTGVSHHKV
jgi:hypothetical protein